MHATKSCQDLLQPLSPLSSTHQAGRHTPPTLLTHLTAPRVQPNPLHRPCSGQGPRSSTSSSTPPLCPSDQTNARSSTPALRVFPRRARFHSRAPTPPKHPQPALATSIWTRAKTLHHALPVPLVHVREPGTTPAPHWRSYSPSLAR
jgi:hypothetical protein